MVMLRVVHVDGQTISKTGVNNLLVTNSILFMVLMDPFGTVRW